MMPTDRDYSPGRILRKSFIALFVVLLIAGVCVTIMRPEQPRPPSMRLLDSINDSAGAGVVVFRVTNPIDRCIFVQGVSPAGDTSNKVERLIFPHDSVDLELPKEWINKEGRFTVWYSEEVQDKTEIFTPWRKFRRKRGVFYPLPDGSKVISIEALDKLSPVSGEPLLTNETSIIKVN
jgi:hypothetical protein